MAFTKTIEDADKYFLPKNHIQAADWDNYEPSEREGAFNQSVRELTIFKGEDLVDPVSDSDAIREDLAVYEQALFLLLNVPRRRNDGSSKVVKLGTDKNGSADDLSGVPISPKSQRYMGKNRLKLVRG